MSRQRLPMPIRDDRRYAKAVLLATNASLVLMLSSIALADLPQPDSSSGSPPPTTAPTTQPAAAEIDQPKAEPALRDYPAYLSLDELLNTTVTLVARQPERIADVASAVQVITGEDIQRSGALTLPEALRLAPNLQVAQVNTYSWAITARGMNGAPAQNNAFANKLLVMIDGRTVYSPLYGGVFWDAQNVLLEDVDRIEVVSGPGGSLWGANAVNGVINVVTRSARDTQGLYFTQANGDYLKNYTAARYGGRIGEDLYYRLYGFGFGYGNTWLGSGESVRDEWDLAQGGFRMDYYPTRDNTFTFQGDIYNGEAGDPVVNDSSGGNLLTRFTHAFSTESDLILQMYVDWRSFEVPTADGGNDQVLFDIDLQHRFPLGDRQNLMWGVNYRTSRDEFDNTIPLALVPAKRTLDLFSVFIQDRIVLVPDRLDLTIGTKLEHNDYSGWEFQPSARIAWRPDDRQTIWAAISRAVRAPTRLDVDVVTPLVVGTDDFESEDLLAYELGYRVQPIDPLALSITAFYHQYDDLRSIEQNPDGPPALVFGNNQEAQTWGIELAGNLQINPRWRLRGGYTMLKTDFDSTSPAVIPTSDAFESNDPRHQVMLQSIIDLPANFQFDTVVRYVDTLQLSAEDVPAYISLDARLAWHYRNYEFALVGRNLLDDRHPEIGGHEMPRSLYGRFTVRW